MISLVARKTSLSPTLFFTPRSQEASSVSFNKQLREKIIHRRRKNKSFHLKVKRKHINQFRRSRFRWRRAACPPCTCWRRSLSSKRPHPPLPWLLRSCHGNPGTWKNQSSPSCFFLFLCLRQDPLPPRRCRRMMENRSKGAPVPPQQQQPLRRRRRLFRRV